MRNGKHGACLTLLAGILAAGSAGSLTLNTLASEPDDFSLYEGEIDEIDIPQGEEKWVQLEGGWQYWMTDGRPVANTWKKIGGNWYFFDQDGWMKTGWINWEGKQYFADHSGAMKTGWLCHNKTWYFFGSDGVMKTGWVCDNGTYYYLDSAGAMKTGWLQQGDNWYYLDNAGARKSGWLKSNGDWYYLNKDGIMLKQQWIQPDPAGPEYFLNRNGIWVTSKGETTLTPVNTSTVPYTAKGVPIVNKKYGLPSNYAPGEDPVALAQMKQMVTKMRQLGLDVTYSYSGFRSYGTQASLYNGYVAANGQALADTFSARPGFSEHQTGLAFDLKHSDGQLVTGAAESNWIANHAHEYGFIVRYQDQWQWMTGYMAEPWHIRYVGKDLAQDIYDSGLCLELFLGVEGGDYR